VAKVAGPRSDALPRPILVRWAIDWIETASKQLSQDAEAALAGDKKGLALCQLGIKALSAALLALGWREQMGAADYTFLIRPYAELMASRNERRAFSIDGRPQTMMRASPAPVIGAPFSTTAVGPT
jgi:hypothetical protein